VEDKSAYQIGILYETLNYVKFAGKTVILAAAEFIDVDCGVSRGVRPKVTDILESPACCSMECEGDECPPREDRCSQVGLRTINAIYNATCRFQVNTVRAPSLLA